MLRLLSRSLTRPFKPSQFQSSRVFFASNTGFDRNQANSTGSTSNESPHDYGAGASGFAPHIRSKEQLRNVEQDYDPAESKLHSVDPIDSMMSSKVIAEEMETPNSQQDTQTQNLEETPSNTSTGFTSADEELARAMNAAADVREDFFTQPVDNDNETRSQDLSEQQSSPSDKEDLGLDGTMEKDVGKDSPIRSTYGGDNSLSDMNLYRSGRTYRIISK